MKKKKRPIVISMPIKVRVKDLIKEQQKIRRRRRKELHAFVAAIMMMNKPMIRQICKNDFDILLVYADLVNQYQIYFNNIL